MNKSRKSFNLDEAKTQASILLKSLHSDDVENIQRAAKRFQCLPEFASLTLAEICQTNIKHKHALNVVAIEHGFTSWMNLKIQLRLIIGGHLNHWFPAYESAKAYQQANGGFLFPYKNQYFVCDAAYVDEIGLNSKHPNWKRIDFDWANPIDKSAWLSLYRKWSGNDKK